MQDAQARPLPVTLGASSLLHASAVRTDMSGGRYDLIKLWVT